MKLTNSFKIVLLLLILTTCILDVVSTTTSPTELPTVNPTELPTVNPSADPTLIPTRHPTESPTIAPTITPTIQPSTKPTLIPSVIPTTDPTVLPTTIDPTISPTIDPTNSPTIDPTVLPTPIPTVIPSVNPTLLPTTIPTVVPTSQPSSSPSGQPSGSPTSGPTSSPTRKPSGQPSGSPSSGPTSSPTRKPSGQPSGSPTSTPTCSPSTQPSSRPSRAPTSQPSSSPTTLPSTHPSSLPSGQPTSSPSAQPIMHPTSSPSSQPSGQPSSTPSTHPLSCPTSQPSVQPTAIPSSQPLGRPTSSPTSQPSAQPSSLPSLQPTSEPTNYPSAQPTSLPSTAPQSRPTSQPSSQPTGTPSCDPTGQPTARPSMYPTSQPSSIPTTTPSSLPSTQPSSVPSSVPSSQPSGAPSSEPTAQPSGAPSTQPTSAPSSMPSGQPTDMPSDLPLSAPTSRPTQQPSTQPSSCPSRQPTDTPTAAPSVSPTAIPSQQPSSTPTSQPSSQPSAQPTQQPSTHPTAQPSSAPSRQPSAQPSTQPSSQPFAVPTSQPSAAPTTYGNTRYYRCNSRSVCEGQSDSSCSFFTPSSVLECEDSSTACTITTGAFSIGPNSTVSVQGGCELVVNASSTITMEANSTLRGSALSLTAQKDIHIYGQLSTAGNGPLYGPGAPDSRELGNGGSYGGSGGQIQCGFTFYSAVPFQIGSMDVYNDLEVNSSNYAATFGSGGGAPGAGLGGGRIALSTPNTLYIYPTGVVAASGSSALNATLGAGSGGSVSIVAKTLSQDGRIEAVGGMASAGEGEGYSDGAAGGGGRIAISVASGNIFDLATSNIYYHGGDATTTATTNTTTNTTTAITRVCAVGGAGTLFIQLRSSTAGQSTAAAIVSSNNNMYTYATTLLHTLPSQTTGIAASDLAVIAPSNGSIVLPSLSTCTLSKIHTTSCSFFYMRNAELITLGNASSIDTTTSSLFTVDSMQIEGSKITGVRNSLYAVNVLTKGFDLSYNSTMEFTQSFKLVSKYYATIKGNVLQQPHFKSMNKDNIVYSEKALLQVSSTGNITVGNMSTANMVLNSNRVKFAVGSNVFKPSGLRDTSCMFNVTQIGLLCHDFNFRPVNNTYVIVGTASIVVREASVIHASQLLLCAPVVKIKASAMLSTSYHGCGPNAGYGSGGIPSNVAGRGGGGGGYGGMGGQGYNAVNSGVLYASHYSMSSGSGGGSLPFNASEGSSSGGGIISIVANTTLVMSGNLTADGGDGSAGTGSGGGAGGAIFINALGMSGAGYISAKGGVGGSYQYAGGGGGGGAVSLYSSVQNFETYTFTGYVTVKGGAAGAGGLSSTSTSTSPFSAAIYAIAPSVALSLGMGDSPAAISYAAGSPASSGGDGVKFLPQCQPGYGNNPTTGAICEICPVGTYSLGENSGPCTECNNAPTHSHYLETGCTTANCPYACDAGYATNHCYNQIQNLIYNRMGVPAFAGMCVGIFLLLMVPLTYQRLKRKYDWFSEDKYKKQKNKKRDLFGIDIFARNSFDDDDDVILDKSTGKHEKIIKMQNFTTTENPVLITTMNRDSGNVENITKIRILRNKIFAERRREHRMNDQDLVFHAYRINLLGNNNPWSLRGSPWHMPIYRPACLRPLLKRTEYRQLAERVNAAAGWPLLTWELLVFVTVSLLAPPLAPYIMKQYRRRRANMLLKIIATYDYSCFRCPKQRAAQNSLRIGISPDSTLAYIDILYDEESFHRRVKPLCPVGQVRLPASFKVAGLGTYFSPYYIDTNDLILQAVPQTDIPSSFINDSWISFVINLNAILRTIQFNSIHLGVYKLIRFLSDEKHKIELGGLVVEFCTFPTVEQPYDTELKHEKQRELTNNTQTTTITTTEAPISSVQASTLSSGTNKIQINNTTTSTRIIENERNSERLDSFGFNTGARKSEEGGWFTNLLDVNVKNPWATSKHPSGVRRPTSLREIELRESLGKTGFQPSDLSVTDQEMNLPVNTTTIPIINNTTSSNNTSTNSSTNATTNIGFFQSILYYFYNNIVFYLSSGYKATDPAGKTLNFHEMCNAIQEGSLSMGIIVTHPKVDQNNYIIQDDDYGSEDSEFYEDDEEDEMLLVNNSEGEFSSGSEHENISRAMSSDSEFECANPALAFSTSPSVDVVRTVSNATDMSLSLQRVYGDKAEEMQKFYNIMLSAEAAQAAAAVKSSLSPVASPAATPTTASKRKSLLNTTDTVDDSSELSIPEEGAAVADNKGIAKEKESLQQSPSTSMPAPSTQRSSSFDSVPGPVPRLSVDAAASSQQPQHSTTATTRMLEFSDFRHSIGSMEDDNTAAAAQHQQQEHGGAADSVEQEQQLKESTPSASTIKSFDASPSVRPVSLLRRGDSTRSVNPSETASEYTEFRPTTRDRKTSISSPSKDSMLRFSEFRHSNVVDDRFSEFRHSNVVDDRVSDYEYYNSTTIENEEESETHNVLEGSEEIGSSLRAGRDRGISEISAGGGVRGVAEEDSDNNSTRLTHMSHKSHRYRSSTAPNPDSSPLSPQHTSSHHTKHHKTNKKKTKKQNRKSANQRNLGQLNLAPSAHQLEFNAWRLVSNTSAPYSSTAGNLANRFLTSFAIPTTSTAAGNQHSIELMGADNSPLHLRSSIMADRSSMITAGDDPMLDCIEEGDGRVIYENPISPISTSGSKLKHVSTTTTSAAVLPINLSDRSRIASLHQHSNDSADRKTSILDFIQSKRTHSAPRNELETGSLDNANSRISDVSMDCTAPAVVLTSTAATAAVGAGGSATSTTLVTPLYSIEEHFKAIYYSRRIFLFLSRFMFGGNVYPLGPPYIRSLLEGILLVLSLADMALGSIICFEYYCVSGDITSCRNHDMLYLMLGVWPLAMIITPLLGVFAIMLGPSGTLTRIYAMWNRLTGVNNLIILVVFFQHYQYFTHLAITTYPPILYTCSRALQCLIVDQYIAHIERLRYTRGWDGLHTSLFKTQDNKVVVT